MLKGVLLFGSVSLLSFLFSQFSWLFSCFNFHKDFSTFYYVLKENLTGNIIGIELYLCINLKN